MFSELWRDLIAIVGLVATLAGLLYAIFQIRKTKSAAESAKNAARKTLEESHASFQRFVATNASRFINEAKIHIDKQDWSMAAIRIDDRADAIAQLVPQDAEWEQFAGKLRQWGATCRRYARRELSTFSKTKWNQFVVGLQTRLDAFCGPFRQPTQEQSNDPGKQVR